MNAILIIINLLKDKPYFNMSTFNYIILVIFQTLVIPVINSDYDNE